MNYWKQVIWAQFAAAIDMLDNAIIACPAGLWADRNRKPEYWYGVFHTLFFLDLYLDGELEGFRPPAPFNLDELEPAGVMPPEVYSQTQMREYLAYCREKCQAKLRGLTVEQAEAPVRIPWQKLTYGELLIDNIRHVQHHTAQLNLMLRQTIDDAPRWITRIKEPL